MFCWMLSDDSIVAETDYRGRLVGQMKRWQVWWGTWGAGRWVWTSAAQAGILYTEGEAGGGVKSGEG